MARPKADYDGLLVQDFLTYNQALAYANCTDDEFKAWYLPYLNVYRCKCKKGQFFIPALRQLILDNVEMKAERSKI